MADAQLAAELGTEFAKMIHGILPAVEKSFGKGRTKASFTVTAKFQVAKNGDTEVILTQASSIPMENAIFKLNFTSGQMHLFEGEVAGGDPSGASSSNEEA